MTQRVVITGIGVFSGLGKNSHQFWNALCAEQTAISPITAVDTHLLRFKQGAEVKRYNSHA